MSMKRKTNLFYLDNDESNFLTFSNYTEHLTGNFLATDYKLFPSRFLCLYIPKLENNIENKVEFIRDYLCAKYENKLAFLRDKIDNPDTELFYLNYLIETIIEFDENTNLDNFYLSEIIEQNYNGTFTDIICTIDSGNKLRGEIVYQDQNSSKLFNYDQSSEYLYGWYNTTIDNINEYVGPEQYKLVKPKFDEVDTNYNTSSTDHIWDDEMFGAKLFKYNYDIIDNEIVYKDTINKHVVSSPEIDNNDFYVNCGIVEFSNRNIENTIWTRKYYKWYKVDKSYYDDNGTVLIDDFPDANMNVLLTPIYHSKTDLKLLPEGGSIIVKTYIDDLDNPIDYSTLSIDNPLPDDEVFRLLPDNSLYNEPNTLYMFINCEKTTVNSEEDWLNEILPQFIKEEISDYLQTSGENIFNNQYRINSKVEKIVLTEVNNQNANIKFNVVIPLYDINNMNYATNKITLDYLTEIDLTIPEINDCVVNVPYGIWFAPETIELKRDLYTNYAPSWSLLIGTQFKPFPTSTYLQQDSSNQETSKAFQTFAQLLSLQNNITNEILKFNTQLASITERLNRLENNINMICDVKQINNLKEEMQTIIDTLKNTTNDNGESVLINTNKWIYKNS